MEEHRQFLDDDDDSEPQSLFAAAPAPGLPVLPCSCEYSAEELRDRMACGIEPDNAQEYLARTRLQAQDVPVVVVCATPLTKKPRREGPLAPAWLAPSALPRSKDRSFSEQARGIAIEAFCRARDALASWDTRLERDPAARARLKPAEFPARQERLQWMEYCEARAPLQHIVLQMDHVVAVRVLRCVTKACELDGDFSHKRLTWMFALLSRIDRDAMVTELAAMLSTLHKLCCKAREAVSGDPHSENLSAINVIIAVLEDVYELGDDDV